MAGSFLEWLRSDALSVIQAVLSNKWLMAAVLIFSGWIFTEIFEHLTKKHAPKSISGKRVRQTIRFAKFTTWVIVAFMVFSYFGLGSDLVLGATVLGAAITFVSQNLLSNVAAGIYILFAKPFSHGEIIKINTIFGEVYDIGLVSTKVRTLNNELVTIPNTMFLTYGVTNYETDDPRIVVEIDMGVEYKADLERVKGIILDTVTHYAIECHKVLLDPKPVIWTMEFGESSIHMRLRVCIDFARDLFIVPSDLREKIKKAFDREGIVIAFPQRVVHMADDSAAKKPSGQK